MVLDEKSNYQYSPSVSPASYNNSCLIHLAHWYNHDINMGVINHFLVRFKFHGIRGRPYMTLSSDHELLSRLVIDSRGEPITLMMLNGHAIKWPSDDLSLHPQSLGF